MIWKIEISKTAAKQLKKLDKTIQKRVISFLHDKVENVADPRKQGKALRGKQGDLWRYRVGDYRLICKIEDSVFTVLVLALGHRKEVYKSMTLT